MTKMSRSQVVEIAAKTDFDAARCDKNVVFLHRVKNRKVSNFADLRIWHGRCNEILHRRRNRELDNRSRVAMLVMQPLPVTSPDEKCRVIAEGTKAYWNPKPMPGEVG